MSEGERKTFLHDEQGNWSMGRLCLAFHTVQTWIVVWLLFLDVIPTPEIKVLEILTGVYASMFFIFGAWVIGPRSFQYILPGVGSLLSPGNPGGSDSLSPLPRQRDDAP